LPTQILKLNTTISKLKKELPRNLNNFITKDTEDKVSSCMATQNLQSLLLVPACLGTKHFTFLCCFKLFWGRAHPSSLLSLSLSLSLSTNFFNSNFEKYSHQTQTLFMSFLIFCKFN
jgi:hypothetical protein